MQKSGVSCIDSVHRWSENLKPECRHIDSAGGIQTIAPSERVNGEMGERKGGDSPTGCEDDAHNHLCRFETSHKEVTPGGIGGGVKEMEVRHPAEGWI